VIDRVATWRLRKCSDVGREYAYYELLHGETVLLEVAATDAGEIEVLFETGAPGHLFSLVDLERALAEARELIKQELTSMM